LAVPVACRLTKPQKPKRKKLASASDAMLLSFSDARDRSQSSAFRRSNSFSFLTAFAPPLTGHRQGRLREAEAWGFIQRYLAYRQNSSLVRKLKFRFSCMESKMVTFPQEMKEA
jgi:hypothetical protein